VRFREAETVAAAWLVLGEARVDLVVMEISLNGPSGLDFIRDLAVRHPKLPVIVFSSLPECRFAERVLRAGGRGFVMKSSPPPVLSEAVRRVLTGGVFVSHAVTEHILLRLSPVVSTQVEETNVLSDRELEVFILIGDGLGTAEISRRLRVSVSTVETYRGAIKRKLGLGSGAELVRAAIASAVTGEAAGSPETKLGAHEGASWKAWVANHAEHDFLHEGVPLDCAG
jgi:DNA-binding NarL/FixJ family response regulator